VQLRFISSEQILDVSHRETTIAIRNLRPERGDLVCPRIGAVECAGYATDKSVKPWAQVIGKTPSAVWLASHRKDASDLEVTSPRNALDLACSGATKAVLPTVIGDRQESLVRVIPPIAELSHDQWLVAHSDERFSLEVRTVIDQVYQAAKSIHNGQ